VKHARKSLIILTASGLLVGGLTLVGAQNTQTGGTPAETQPGTQTETQAQNEPLPRSPHDFGGFGFRGPGFRGLPFGPHLALGTTVEVTFYDGDPDAGGSVTETLTFTYGEDSEAAFAQAFAEAREDAQYMVVNVGEQVQTLELADTEMNLRDGLPFPLRGLEEGGTLEATFYDGDPEANGQVLQTLSFTYGQESAAGFAAEFAEAAEEAAFVRVTQSPQSYTVDLSATPFREDGFPGRRGFSRDGFGPLPLTCTRAANPLWRPAQ